MYYPFNANKCLVNNMQFNNHMFEDKLVYLVDHITYGISGLVAGGGLYTHHCCVWLMMSGLVRTIFLV